MSKSGICIVGIGHAAFGRFDGRTAEGLIAEAARGCPAGIGRCRNTRLFYHAPESAADALADSTVANYASVLQAGWG